MRRHGLISPRHGSLQVLSAGHVLTARLRSWERGEKTEGFWQRWERGMGLVFCCCQPQFRGAQIKGSRLCQGSSSFPGTWKCHGCSLACPLMSAPSE